MDDKSLHDQINELVAEERELRRTHLGRGLTGQDRTRLDSLERHLDQLWDLLRQRKAREEFGEDPSAANERSTGEVEGYLQ